MIIRWVLNGKKATMTIDFFTVLFRWVIIADGSWDLTGVVFFKIIFLLLPKYIISGTGLPALATVPFKNPPRTFYGSLQNE
jgi:hypothetical protein